MVYLWICLWIIFLAYSDSNYYHYYYYFLLEWFF